jgi:hypothetical protein
MWAILFYFFGFIINIFIWIYFKRVNPTLSAIYSKELLSSFIKYSWIIGVFALIRILFQLIKNNNSSLNAGDPSYQFHNLATKSANYLKLNYSSKINFLVFMLSLSLIFIVFYGIWFLILLLPLRTLLIGTATQILGFDFVGLLQNITDVYIPQIKLWIFENLGIKIGNLPIKHTEAWSSDDINRISGINRVYDTLNNPLQQDLVNNNNEIVDNYLNSTNSNSTNDLLIFLFISASITGIFFGYYYWDDILILYNNWGNVDGGNNNPPLIGSQTPSSASTTQYDDFFKQVNTGTSSSSSASSVSSTGSTSSSASSVTVRGLQVNTQINNAPSLLTSLTPSDALLQASIPDNK